MTAPESTIGSTVLDLLSGTTPAALPRHRHGLSRDDVRESQTARILAAAVDLFATHGYASTSVMQIAKQAGVSRKTFYELYETKEDVFLDSYRAVRVLLDAAGAAEFDAAEMTTAAMLDELPRVIERLLAILALAPAATRMFFLEALGAGPRVRARRNDAITEFVDAVLPPLARLRAATEPGLPPLESHHGYAIVAATIELIVQHLGRAEPETLTALAPTLTALVLAIVTPNRAI